MWWLADPLELLLLQHAQQLDLGVERQLAHLVQEQGALVGQLEAPDPALQRAGERALLVAEQLALDHALRDRAAVDLDERPVAARAPLVQRPGDSSLPVPVSPVSSTVVSTGATCCTFRSTARSAGLSPTIPSNPRSSAIASWR